MSRLASLLIVALLPVLAGCDQLGIETPQQTAARKESEAKAVGAGCRQTGRAIEDCYALNPKASKAAVFAGWREMDEYMRENKLEVVAAVVAPNSLKPPEPPPAADEEDEEDQPAPHKSAKDSAEH